MTDDEAITYTDDESHVVDLSLKKKKKLKNLFLYFFITSTKTKNLLPAFYTTPSNEPLMVIPLWTVSFSICPF